jgi:hypothetical protein
MGIVAYLWNRGSKTVLTFLRQTVNCKKLDGPGPGRLRRCRDELGLRFPPGLMTEGLAHGEAFRLSAPVLLQIRHQRVDLREQRLKCAVILQPIVKI